MNVNLHVVMDSRRKTPERVYEAIDTCIVPVFPAGGRSTAICSLDLSRGIVQVDLRHTRREKMEGRVSVENQQLLTYICREHLQACGLCFNLDTEELILQ